MHIWCFESLWIGLTNRQQINQIYVHDSLIAAGAWKQIAFFSKIASFPWIHPWRKHSNSFSQKKTKFQVENIENNIAIMSKTLNYFTVPWSICRRNKKNCPLDYTHRDDIYNKMRCNMFARERVCFARAIDVEKAKKNAKHETCIAHSRVHQISWTLNLACKRKIQQNTAESAWKWMNGNRKSIQRKARTSNHEAWLREQIHNRKNHMKCFRWPNDSLVFFYVKIKPK